MQSRLQPTAIRVLLTHQPNGGTQCPQSTSCERLCIVRSDRVASIAITRALIRWISTDDRRSQRSSFPLLRLPPATQYLMSRPVWRPCCLVCRFSCRQAALLFSLAARHACFVCREPWRVSCLTSRAARRCCACSVAHDISGRLARNIAANKAITRDLKLTVV